MKPTLKTLPSRVESVEEAVIKINNQLNQRISAHQLPIRQTSSRDYKKLKLTRPSDLYKSDRLENVSWNARDPVEKASRIDDDDEEYELNLTKRVFDHPVSLIIESRGILQAIHDHIKAYEEACEEGDESGDDSEYGMGDRVWFEGLICDNPFVWHVCFGS
ncbi:hypothetical protein IFM61392_10080 [Aspergillus lentulus]|nr:hypothetical protein IFM61392_10080 [Aspergillus lentulus]